MPIIAVCSKCGKSYRFRDERRGQTLPCKQCGTQIIVPSADLPTIEMGAFEPDADSESNSSLRKVQLIDEGLSEEYEVFVPSEASLPELSADYIPAGSSNSKTTSDKSGSKISRRQSESDVDPDIAESDSRKSNGLIWMGIGVAIVALLGLAALMSPDDGARPSMISAVEPGANQEGNAQLGGVAPEVDAAVDDPQPLETDTTDKGNAPQSPTDSTTSNRPPIANNDPSDPMPANAADAAVKNDDAPNVGEPKAVGNQPVQPDKPLNYEPLFELPRVHRTSVVFAPENKSFVAIDWEVFDLESRKRVGATTVRVAERHLATQMSPDGTLLAVSKRLTRGWSIPLYSAKSGKKLSDLTLSNDTRPSLRLMRFTSPTTLLCIYRSNIVHWSLENYRVRHSLPLKVAVESGKVALSNDARRAIIATDKELLIVSCASGKRLVSAELPPDPAAEPFAACRAIAFSPNDNEFACWLDDRLVILGSAGAYLKIVRIPAEIRKSIDSYHFQYLPNNRGILIGGQYLVHRDSGRIVWKAEFDSNYRNVPYRVVEDGKLIRAIGNSIVGKLVSVEIPWPEISDRLLQYAQSVDPAEKSALFPIITDLRIPVSVKRVEEK